MGQNEDSSCEECKLQALMSGTQELLKHVVNLKAAVAIVMIKAAAAGNR